VRQASLLIHRLCPSARYGEATLVARSPGTAMKFKDWMERVETVADLNSTMSKVPMPTIGEQNHRIHRHKHQVVVPTASFFRPKTSIAIQGLCF